MHEKNTSLNYESINETTGATFHDGDGVDLHNPYRSEDLLPLNEAQEKVRVDAMRPKQERPLTQAEADAVRVGHVTYLTARLRYETQADSEQATPPAADLRPAA